jgi:hypothetical protein
MKLIRIRKSVKLDLATGTYVQLLLQAKQAGKSVG